MDTHQSDSPQSPRCLRELFFVALPAAASPALLAIPRGTQIPARTPKNNPGIPQKNAVRLPAPPSFRSSRTRPPGPDQTHRHSTLEFLHAAAPEVLLLQVVRYSAAELFPLPDAKTSGHRTSPTRNNRPGANCAPLPLDLIPAASAAFCRSHSLEA